MRTTRQAEIEIRQASGAPLVNEAAGEDGVDPPLAPLGEYGGDPDLDGIMVTLRKLPKDALMSLRAMEHDAFAIGDPATADDTDDKKNRQIEMMSALVVHRAHFVACTVIEVTGLEDESGEYCVVAQGTDVNARVLDAEQILALQGADLLFDLYQAASYFQGLTGAERKNFGASRLRTCPNSTVDAVPNKIAANVDATQMV